jgi:hypothetical protein
MSGMRRGKGEKTYNGERKSDTENKSVETHDPRRVLALDNPRRKSDSLTELLLSIGMAVKLVVVSADLIGETVRSERSQ